MKQILSQGKKLIIKQGISLLAVFSVLVVTLVAFLPNLSFGWFSKNNTVSANGMMVKAETADLVLSYRVVSRNGVTVANPTWTEISLSDPIAVATTIQAPGDTVTFEIRVVNRGRTAINLTGFGLAAPSGTVEESPKQDSNGNPCYLSTQLFTSLLKVNDSATGITPVDTYLRDSGGAGAVDYFDQMDLVDGKKPTVPLTADGGQAVFQMTLTFFFDHENSQNVYKFFDEEGNCQRRLFLTYDDART